MIFWDKNPGESFQQCWERHLKPAGAFNNVKRSSGIFRRSQQCWEPPGFFCGSYTVQLWLQKKIAGICFAYQLKGYKERIKVEEVKLMRKNIESLLGDDVKKRLHFIEIEKTTSLYITIDGQTMYFTPALDKRVSDTFTFKLKNSPLIGDLLNYMKSRIENIDNGENEIFINELETIKIDKLFKDIKTSKQVKIIGVSVIASSEFRIVLEDVLFSDLKAGKKKCIIIAESENQLFQHSLLTDTTNSEKRLSFNELKLKREFFFNEFTRTEGKKMNSDIRISSLTLPFFAIQIDANIWHLPVTDFDADN